jgi:predicted dehydrogenase
MKVSIIGARKKRSGIGEYIGKYFHRNGATITSVLGTAEKTARDASLGLRKYGIDSTPYTDFYRMVESEKPDTAVIASPPSTHYEYLVKCVDLGLNIFCEKPFVWQETNDIREIVEHLFEKAEQKNVAVAMNSQWPFSIRYYEEMCGPIDSEKTNTFSITMSPLSRGREMIPESLPHALSMLYSVFGDGEIVDLLFQFHEGEMVVKFRYQSETNDCDVFINLVRKVQQPRDFCFGFNDRIVHRILDFVNYDIYFGYENKKIKIIDPLELSVRDFIEAVRGQREPLIAYRHIMSTMSLLKGIYDNCPDV